MQKVQLVIVDDANGVHTVYLDALTARAIGEMLIADADEIERKLILN